MPATAKSLRPGEPFNAILPRAHWRDQRDLMERPFFSLSKKHRLEPIDYHSRDIRIHVTGDPAHGIATIWDADILIWATSQIVAALERGLTPSKHLRIIPYQLLQDIGAAPASINMCCSSKRSTACRQRPSQPRCGAGTKIRKNAFHESTAGMNAIRLPGDGKALS